MPNLNILAMPVGTITSFEVTDEFYYRLNYEHFGIVSVKSSDIRVQNLPTRDDILEMPIAAFDSLQTSASLYEKMAQNLAHYAQMSSQGVVDFLTKDILSASFGEQMPPIFTHFPPLVTAYEQKFKLPHFASAMEKSRQVFLLRPKFVLSVLQAYFEQQFVITQANLSQEKFANASFFDGSSEFRINVTVADVIMPTTTPTDEQGYDVTPITLDIAGKYQPATGYTFDLASPKLLNEAVLSADRQLQANKIPYLTKIIAQSRTAEQVADFETVLQQVGQAFVKAEAVRLEQRFR